MSRRRSPPRAGAPGTRPAVVIPGPAGPRPVLEAVVNVSEGCDAAVLAELAEAAGDALLDVHTDADHHRSVLSIGGEPAAVEEAVRRAAAVAVARIDLRTHRGAHPRIGALDVVPFVALDVDAGNLVRDGDPALALAARQRFAAWAGRELGLPCFLYGPPPEPTLPELRRRAWRSRRPDAGPDHPHRSAGAACVGARPVLVAYNLWLRDPDLAEARRVARLLRGPAVRSLGLAVGDRVQVSCNLIAPWQVGPAQVHEQVSAEAAVAGAELVGLVPAGVLAAVPAQRWADLDLAPDRTIEARLGLQAGLDGGRSGVGGTSRPAPAGGPAG